MYAKYKKKNHAEERNSNLNKTRSKNVPYYSDLLLEINVITEKRIELKIGPY